MSNETTVDVGDADEKAVNVIIENEGGKPQRETQAEAEPAKPRRQEAQGSDDDISDEELQQYSAGVRRRIGKLTFKAREEARQKEEALVAAAHYKRQAEELQQRVGLTDRNLVNEYGNRLTIQEQMLNTRLADAIERGDAAKQIELNKQLATLAIEQERVRNAKSHYEAQDKARQQNPQAEQVPRPPQAQQVQQAQPDPRAQRWAAENKWFGQDQTMTLTAFALHKTIVEEGFDPTSEEYYEELDSRLRQELPHKFRKNDVEDQDQEEDPKPTPRPQRQVAGARPTTANITRVNGQTQVRLTPSQVAIARRLGVPLDQYAKEVAKIQ
jgi:hypothetical protein